MPTAQLFQQLGRIVHVLLVNLHFRTVGHGCHHVFDFGDAAEPLGPDFCSKVVAQSGPVVSVCNDSEMTIGSLDELRQIVDPLDDRIGGIGYVL